MIQLIKTNSENNDFISLVNLLDAGLQINNGDKHGFYSQFNTLSNIRYVIVVFDNQIPMGCGALKEYQPGTMEIKRMFVRTEARNKGIATTILAALETWAIELGYTECILETGEKQIAAIALYNKSGYIKIPNYGQYENVAGSICFQKKLH